MRTRGVRALHPGTVLGKILLAIPAFGVATVPAAALTVLPWTLCQFPDGGSEMVAAVAKPLIVQSDLLVPSCQALAPGTVQQAASGFTGIGIAISTSEPADSGD